MSSNLHQPIAALPVISNIGHCPPHLLLRWRVRHERLRFSPRDFQDIQIAHNVGNLQGRETGLLGAKELTRSTELHIHFRDKEAVARVDQGPDALPSRRTELLRHQNAVTLSAASPDTAAK